MMKKEFRVKTMLINILTAGVFVFGMAMTACSDDIASEGSFPAEDKAPAGADTRLLEAYGLMYTDFVSEGDVQILNADTTEIAVSKQLADKLGITSFVGHPLGIWQAIDELPYARKATEERLTGDRYILKVQTATVAELIGEKNAQLSTSVYVNNDAPALTRAAANGFSAYGAKYVDQNGTIHPAVIHLTDPDGYDKPYHNENDAPTLLRSIAKDGRYQYYTADELVHGTTRGPLGATMHVNVLSIHDKLTFRHKFEMQGAPTDTIVVSGNVPIDFDLNYFMTLEGGVKWDGWLPDLYVKKFETGLDGDFAFSPEAYLSFAASAKLKEEYQRLTLATFGQYTFTFVVGVVPVSIVVKPALYMKFNANAEGSVRVGFKYDYANRFKAGIRYKNGWSVIKDFEELKNDFKYYKPEANFTANANMAFYLGVNVMVYGVAGPEIGVGPQLSSKLSGTYRPFEDDPDKRTEVKANVELKVHAFAGAKISLLGYKLAQWSTETVLAGPWTIYKYPSDGSEHKDPNKQKQEKKNAFWNKAVTAISGGSAIFTEEYEALINKLMDMDDLTRDEAISIIANSVLNDYDITMIDLTNITTLGDLKTRYENCKERINENYTDYCIKKNVYEIGEMIKANEAFQHYSNTVNGWGESIDFLMIGKEFEKTYHRQPEQNASDVKTMLELTIAAGKICYQQNSMYWSSAYSYLMTHVYPNNEWYPKYCKQRAAYDTMMIWSNIYKKEVGNSINWEQMAMDFNANINNIYQIARSGIEIK